MIIFLEWFQRFTHVFESTSTERVLHVEAIVKNIVWFGFFTIWSIPKCVRQIIRWQCCYKILDWLLYESWKEFQYIDKFIFTLTAFKWQSLFELTFSSYISFSISLSLWGTYFKKSYVITVLKVEKIFSQSR